ncbi:MAG: hypothetical protein NTV52_23350 [Acidobacteria bacterium]|nr:hypothetical protein [Acidobacteriota bacterium]
MKTILIGLLLGLALQAQPYGGRPSGPSGYGRDQGYSRNNFAARIAQGERSGFLTSREARRLWDMERHLRQEIDRSSRFGFSGRERDRIARLSSQLDFEIERQMRDGERAYRGGGYGRR